MPHCLYGNKFDHDQYEMVGRGEVPPDGWGGALRDAVATNWGVPVSNVTFFEVTNANHVDKIERGVPWIPSWQGAEGPDAVLQGLDFSVANSLKFFANVVWESGKNVDTNENDPTRDVVYLRNNQSVSFSFRLRRYVEGDPGDLVTGNRNLDIPFMFNGQVRRLLCNFVDGVSQPFTVDRSSNLVEQGEMEFPLNRYRNGRFEITGKPLVIRQSTNGSELAWPA